MIPHLLSRRIYFVLISMGALCTCPAIGQLSTYGSNAVAGHYLNTRGIKLYYETYGSGKPLLVIHGNGGSISSLRYQIAYFSKKYKVVAVDSRAQGRSVDAADSLSFEQMADDFNALLDSLHLDSCFVIGWSDGGINALLLAIRHPGKVRKMAITGTNLTPDTTALTPFCYDDMTKASEKLHGQTQTPEVKNAAKVLDIDLNQPHIGLEQLHTIACPALVIGGDHDVIPVRHTVLIAENIDQSYLWIIPNSGHSTPVAKREQFNRIVSDFFSHPYRRIEGQATYE